MSSLGFQRVDTFCSTGVSSGQELLMEILKVHGNGLSTCQQARDEAKGFFEPPSAVELFLSKFPSLNPFMAFHLARLPYNLRNLISCISSQPSNFAQFPSYLPARALKNFAEDVNWGARNWTHNAIGATPAHSVPVALYTKTPLGAPCWTSPPEGPGTNLVALNFPLPVLKCQCNKLHSLSFEGAHTASH